MARGESPFQGRYTVPQVDFSPIAQAGRDWGRAFEGIGREVEEYKLNKQERLTTEASIEGILENNPEVMDKMKTHPDMGPLIQKQIAGKATLSDVRQINSFVKSNMAEQERRMRSELLEYQRDKEKDVRTNIVRRQRELGEISSTVQGWVDKGETREDAINQLTPTQRATLADMPNILRGEPSDDAELQARQREYNMKILMGNLKTLGERQRLAEKQLARQVTKLDKGPSVDKEIELDKARLAADLESARAVSGQLERQKDIQQEQLTSARWANSDEMRKMKKEDRDANLNNIKSLIKARDMQAEANLQKALAAMNPSDSKLYEANDKELKAAFTRIVTWEDDGKQHSGSYEKWLEKFSLDEDLVPSQGIIDNEDKIKGLWFEQEQIGGRNRVWVDDSSPAEQAAAGAVDETRFLGAGDRPIEEDPTIKGAFDPALREEIINRARAKGLSDDDIRMILGE